MVIEIDCPGCGKHYGLDGALAGKKAKCKACSHVFQLPVPRATSTPPVDPSARLGAIWDEDDPAPLPARKPPARPIDDESPPRARVKKPRRPVESPISNQTVATLIGLFFGVSLLAFLGVIVGGATGLFSSVQAGTIFGMIFFLACLAMMAVGLIALLVVAFSEDVTQGLLCLFVPFYSLYYTVTRWQAAKGPFAIGLSGFGSLAALFGLSMVMVGLAASRNGPRPGAFLARDGAAPRAFQQQVERQAASITNRYGDRAVTILVAGLPRNGDPSQGITTGDVTTAIGDRVKQRVPGLQTAFGSGMNDRFILVVAPIDDPAALADRIDFGRATLKGRTIEVMLSADFLASVEPQPRESRPSIAARPSNAAGQGPAASEPAIPAGADAITRSLLELPSTNRGKKVEALHRLERTSIQEDRRAEVVQAILPVLEDDDGFLVNDAIRALTHWANDEAIPPLIERTRDNRFGVRWEALKALGTLKDPRVAAAIADRLKEDGIAAEPALKALGPLAEPALITKLKDPDEAVRRKACDLLKVLGGHETLRAMAAIPPDPDLGVRHAAQEAYKQIVARAGPLPRSEMPSPRSRPATRRRRPKL